MNLSYPDPQKALEYFAAKAAFTTGPMELEKAIREGGVQVIDVRDASDFDRAHVPGSINLPRHRWSTCEGLATDKLNVLVGYSQVCHLAAEAAVQFIRKGYSVIELEGGYEGWKNSGLLLEGNTPWSDAALLA